MSTIPNLSRALTAAVVTALLLAAGHALAAPVELTIVHFNDLDRMEDSGGQGGIARLAAVINAERAMHDNVIVTFAGDTISPSLMSGFDQGAHMIELLNRLGLTAMAIGNHEYDFGPQVAMERIAEADFPMLGANNIDADGEIIDGAQESILVDVGPFQVGIFGLTTLGTAVKSSPGSVTFRDVEEVAAEQSAALREAGAELVIALAHTDTSEDRALMRQGAVDLLLSGDDHQLRVDFSGDVLFAESGEQADWVTVIDLTLDEVERRGSMRFTWSPAFRIINTARVAPDAELAAAAQVYLDQLSEELDVEIGSTATELDSRRETIRGKEAAIANLIADAMQAATGADIALTNGGGIRANRIYEPGTTLTRRDILSELPFGNKTVVLEMTGRDIVAALENGLGRIEDGAGRFPHVSGLNVLYDPGKPAGERVIEVSRDGAALDPDATITLATNDYLGNGGDGYDVFEDKVRVIDAYAGTLMASQVIDYIAGRGSVAPVVDGRLKTVE
jgi:2',3'-cyclic-nucleotide 2'-phosphodiesterase (5'-nucleotidase family)